MKDLRTSYYSVGFALPALLIYFVFFLLPGIVGFGLSFTDWYIDRLFSPKFIGLENFINIFQTDELKLAVSNTFLFSIVTVVLKNVFGLLLAILVTSSFVKFKNYYRVVLYFPNIVSFVVIGLLFSSIYQPQGIINSFFGSIGLDSLKVNWLGNRNIAIFSVSLMDVWQSIGFHMVIYIAGLIAIPRDYYEAANIDGANSIQQFKSITLPLIMTTFNINFVLSIITGLKVFVQVYVLTNGGPGNSTEVISTMVFKLFGEGRLGLSSACTFLLTAIVALISISVLKILKRNEVEI